MLRNANYVYGPRDVNVPMRINFGEFVLSRLLQRKDAIAIIDEAAASSVTYGQLAQEAVSLAVSLTCLGVQQGDVVAICSENCQAVWSAVLGVTCAGAVMTPLNMGYTQATEDCVTYGQLGQGAVSLAVSLTRLGVRQGDVVAICSENHQDVWSAVLGVTCAGAVVTPLDMGYTAGELTHTLNISKPKYIISSPKCYQIHGKFFRTQKFVQKIIMFGDERIPNTIAFNDLVKDNVRIEDFEVPDVKGQEDTLFILYSSGTTGHPKGVMLTHLNVITTLLLPSFQEAEEYPSPVSINVIPWFSAVGFMGFLIDLAAGKTIVTLPKFDVDLYMRTIEKYKVTRLTVVRPMLFALATSDFQYDVSSVKYFTCEGRPLPANILPTFKARFPGVIGILGAYGMTEATLAVSKEFPDGKTAKPDSVGPVVSGCVVKVADLDTRKPLGPLQQGEICIKSVTLMKGYIGQDMGEDLDKDGFFRTGDFGYCDEEGFLYLVDRLEKLFYCKGNQVVAPAEIEAVLLQHDAVREARVVGVWLDAWRVQVPRAFVVAQPGRRVTDSELQLFVQARLSDPKHLRGGVRFVSKMPTGLQTSSTCPVFYNN